MKVDKQRRLTIPHYFVESSNMKAGRYYLCDYNGKIYITQEVTEEDKILVAVMMDSKNRIVIPKYLKCYVDTAKEITVYEQKAKVWIENYEKVAE